MTVSRLQTAILVLSFSFLTLAAANLSKADKELLRETYKEDQKFFLLNPYLEGDVKGLHVYKIRSDSPPEFHKSWRDVVNPERRLLRGDKIILESVKVKKDHLELRIKTIERKTVHATASQRFLATALFGLPGLAAGQGPDHMQPQSKLRFFGDTVEEIKGLVENYLSSEPPKIELQPGMSPAEVKEILGDPLEVFIFGGKMTFKYMKMEVIFVDDKLDDIRFQEVGKNVP